MSPPTPAERKKKIARFRAYNQARKMHAVQFRPPKAAFLFKIVPLLLHVNHPDLPGYIDDPACPCGIHHFRPRQSVPRELCQRYFPQLPSLARVLEAVEDPPPPAIHSLKTIGSIGTVAQTEKSDCDYWVSVRLAELGDHRPLLEKKCAAIEQWAATQGFEIHFFLMDIIQTRDNSFESRAEDESAGSSLKLLLKDELFRTHIVVAGKIPLWWLIPPGLTDDEYQSYVGDLVDKARINLNNFVDLGYLSAIPKAETFGACLWQMNKALDSPFKSVIKFAYLELLLGEEKDTHLRLFSDTIKCLVTFPEHLPAGDKPLEIPHIDPYLLLARDIVAFYQREKTEKKRDQFIRICLFLKCIEGMASDSGASRQSGRMSHVTRLMEEWDLLPDNLDHYLNYQHWTYRELVDLGARIHDYLINTYKRLRWYFRRFEREKTGLTITEHDIAVLGRKLFTFHHKKEGKVEYINTISRERMAMDEITLHVARLKGEDVFFAFQGEHTHLTIKDNKHRIIKRDPHLIRLLVWLQINGILTRHTTLHLTKNYLPVELADIQELTATLLATFPVINFSHISSDQLLAPERITQALAVVNFDKAPVRGNEEIRSTIVTCNSYGEYFVEDHATIAQYKAALVNLLTGHEVSRWNHNLEVYIPPQPEHHALKSILES